VSALDEIVALVDIGRRTPGSDAERRAARYLETRLSALGRRADVEPIQAWPNWPPAYALCAALSLAGSLLSVSSPVAGTAAAVAGALLLFLDAGLLLPVARRLSGRRASQNVISFETRDRPGLIVLVAHYDAGRGGLALARRLRRGFGPRALWWAQLGVLACCAARVAGLDALALGVIQFVPTVALLVALALLIDIALAPTRGGENDNASGVALALRLAERLGRGRLEHFDVGLVFPGAQKALAAGMRGFLKSHRAELARESTVLINLDEVGSGSVHVARKEGPLVGIRAPAQLLDLCEAPTYAGRSPSDCYAARLGGFAAVTISCHGPDGRGEPSVEESAIESAEAFCVQLMTRLDAELGPDLPPAVRSSG
jgi:Peptidase family M28